MSCDACAVHAATLFTTIYTASVHPIVYPPCTSPPTVYTLEQLLSMKPSPLHLDLTSCLHHLWIGLNLPWFRGRRWGRRKHKKIDIIVCTSDCTWRTKGSGVDFTNLISVPFSSERPSTKRNCKIIVAVAVSQLLLPSITSVTNDSLLTGSFPSAFKTTVVRPLVKKSSLDTENLNEFYATQQGMLSSAKWHAIADDRLSDCCKVVSG